MSQTLDDNFKLILSGQFLTEFKCLIYQSIALKKHYKISFETKSFRLQFCPQIAIKVWTAGQNQSNRI